MPSHCLLPKHSVISPLQSFGNALSVTTGHRELASATGIDTTQLQSLREVPVKSQATTRVSDSRLWISS